MYYNKLRRLGMGLSRELWVVQVGIFLNMLGYGAVLPFEVIYLHSGRGLSLGLAGAVVGVVTGLAVVVAPAVGPVIDRVGPRTTATAGGIALAAGYAGLAAAHTPWQALVAAVFAGVGNGALLPSQSTLLAALAPRTVRHRASAVSRVSANVGFGLGGAIGGVVAAYGLDGYVALFLTNAVTYLLYVAILLAVVRADVRGERVVGGYRRLLRDRPFGWLALTNVAVIAVGWGVLPWVVPPYAQRTMGLGAQLIGLLLFANSITVVAAQIPVTRRLEGHRRATAMAVAGLLFCVACLLFLAAGKVGLGLGYAALVVGAVVVGIGECFHTTALMPLVADLAPEALRGRYMAAMGLSWWLGLAVAPAAGTRLLAISPEAVLLPAAALAVASSVSVLALDARLPASIRTTPRALEQVGAA
jgi:MFS family permease